MRRPVWGPVLLAAGSYSVRLEVEGLGSIEVPDLTLSPGERVVLGTVRLYP